MTSDNAEVRGIICLPRIYKYQGFIFKFHSYCGIIKLNKDLNPSKRMGNNFFSKIDEWCDLSKDEKEKTLYIEGGCFKF